VERDGSADGMVGAVAPLAMLDIQFLIEEAPPEDDGFAREVRLDGVCHPLHDDPRVDADFPAFGLTGKRTEPLPVTHGAEPGRGQMLEPVLQARMRFGAMLHAVILQQKLHQPRVGLGFRLRFMKVVEGLVHFFDGAKGAFDSPFGPCRHALAVCARRQMGAQLNP
jgi:hypothetical protein